MRKVCIRPRHSDRGKVPTHGLTPTALHDAMPVCRNIGVLLWIYGSPNDDPLGAAIALDPDRWINVEIALGRPHLNTRLLKLLFDHLHGKLVKLPGRHLDLLRPTPVQADQSADHCGHEPAIPATQLQRPLLALVIDMMHGQPPKHNRIANAAMTSQSSRFSPRANHAAAMAPIGPSEGRSSTLLPHLRRSRASAISASLR